MAKLQPVTQNKLDGTKTVKGYKIALKKSGIKNTGFGEDDELEIEYKPKKIIITKKEN